MFESRDNSTVSAAILCPAVCISDVMTKAGVDDKSIKYVMTTKAWRTASCNCQVQTCLSVFWWWPFSRVSVPLWWIPLSLEYFNTVCLSRPSQVHREDVQRLRGFRWAARGTDVPDAGPLSRDQELSRHQVSRQQTGCWRQTSGGWLQSDWRVSKVKFRKF